MKCHHCDKQATVHLTQHNVNAQNGFAKLVQANGVTNPEIIIGTLMIVQKVKVSLLLVLWCANHVVQLTRFKRVAVSDVKLAIMFFVQYDPLLDGMHAGTQHSKTFDQNPVKSTIRGRF